MKTFVATIILNLADKHQERKPDDEMIKRYLQNVVVQGVVEKMLFRQRVNLKIKNVKIEVQEV